MVNYKIVYMIEKILINSISIDKVELFNALINILSVAITVYIAYRVEKYTKKQDEKILADNKMQRIANYYSNIILSDNPITFLLDYKQLQNSGLHTKFVQIFNIHFDQEAIVLDLKLKSISNIIPTQAKITKITLWNSKTLNNDSISDELLSFEYNNTFNSVGILENDELMISIIIGINKEDKQKIQRWIDSNEYINIGLEIAIRNQFYIETKSELYGTYKNYSIINGCYLIKLERRYLKIIKTEEIDNE